MSTQGVWREPDEESLDLYPGLCVHDGRMSGSITAGPTRGPLWCFIHTAIIEGWDEVKANWPWVTEYGLTDEKLASFLYDLLEARGEFGRLLLVLADAERREQEIHDVWCGERDNGSGIVAIPLDGTGPPAWWQVAELRDRVADQLRRCLSALELEASVPS